MPKLLMFTPCERVIMEQGSDAASLIILMHRIAVKSDEPKDRAKAPIRWTLFTQWEVEKEDQNKEFLQQVTMTNETTGEVVLKNTAAMKFGEKQLHRGAIEYHYFPLAPGGPYRFRVFLAPSGTESWKEYGEHPFHLEYNPNAPDPRFGGKVENQQEDQ